MQPRDEYRESIDALGKISFLLKHVCQVDFSLYKQATLKRRISRRMVLQRIERLDDYATILRSNPQELKNLFQDLLINVTSFFRDRGVYATLKKKVFPGSIKRKGDQGEIRIWVPGCATGEEVYSLAICLVEEMSKAARSLKFRIFGTDLSETTIGKARTGIFPATIARDVSPDRLRRFFSPLTAGGYQINRMIRDVCTFARQNICEDPPFSRLDLVSCRNVLIYLGPELQKRCMSIFHYALDPGGYLLLGASESVGVASELFTLVDRKRKLYSRKPIAPQTDLGFTAKGTLASKPGLADTEPTAGREVEPASEVQKQADRILLTQYTPPGVIVDRQLRVHHFRGGTGRFLEHAPGSATLNLLQMVRPSLLVDLRTAVHQALKDRRPIRKESVFAVRALRAGAHGYVMKQEPPERLLAGIRTVLRGDYFLSETAVNAFLKDFFGRPMARETLTSCC
ncbi:MAG: CheR family methyltransferase [Limisphaerales bacterium]